VNLTPCGCIWYQNVAYCMCFPLVQSQST